MTTKLSSKYNPPNWSTQHHLVMGKKGHESNEPGFDNLAIARSGLMMAAGESDAPPVEIRGFIGDCLAGTFLLLVPSPACWLETDWERSRDFNLPIRSVSLDSNGACYTALVGRETCRTTDDKTVKNKCPQSIIQEPPV